MATKEEREKGDRIGAARTDFGKAAAFETAADDRTLTNSARHPVILMLRNRIG